MKILKRMTAILLVTCLVIPCFFERVSAESGSSLFQKVETKVGETFTVTGTVVAKGDVLADATVEMSYDTSYIRFLEGDGIKADGEGNLTFTGSGGEESECLVFVMMFQALKEGNTSIKQERVTVTNKLGQTVVCENGHWDVSIAAADPSESQSVGKTTKVVIDGQEYILSEAFAETEIPEGFIQGEYSYKEITYKGVVREEDGSVAAYLIDREGIGKFWIYDKEKSKFYPMEKEGNVKNLPDVDGKQGGTVRDKAPEESGVAYSAYVNGDGWKGFVKNGALGGTTGQSKALGGLKIKLENKLYEGSVQYKGHVQDKGWDPVWTEEGNITGTADGKKRLEAVEIRLTDQMANAYDIYYRAHVQNFGWLGWAKNGAESGSQGYGYRMEAIEIQLVKKGEEAPGSTEGCFKKKITVQYSTHVQNIGWQSNVKDGATAGTSGKSLRIEAMKIQLSGQQYKGNIRYSTHVQNKGWLQWVSNGAVSGTTGKSLRVEAIKIQLTDELAEKCDIYYRVHAQDFGWLAWTKNGAQAGSQGWGRRLEAVQIKIVEKGDAAPSTNGKAFYYKNNSVVQSLSEKLGVNPDLIINELLAHQLDKYYLTTPYKSVLSVSDPAQVSCPNGKPGKKGAAMNCTGFVAFVFKKCGTDLAPIENQGRYGGYCNAINWFSYIKSNKVEYYKYDSVRDLLQSGKAEKGDIIYCDPQNWNVKGADCHIGFFWGNNFSDNKYWHSSTYLGKGNQISQITPVTNPSYYYLVKLK